MRLWRRRASFPQVSLTQWNIKTIKLWHRRSSLHWESFTKWNIETMLVWNRRASIPQVPLPQWCPEKACLGKDFLVMTPASCIYYFNGKLWPARPAHLRILRWRLCLVKWCPRRHTFSGEDFPSVCLSQTLHADFSVENLIICIRAELGVSQQRTSESSPAHHLCNSKYICAQMDRCTIALVAHNLHSCTIGHGCAQLGSWNLLRAQLPLTLLFPTILKWVCPKQARILFEFMLGESRTC